MVMCRLTSVGFRIVRVLEIARRERKEFQGVVVIDQTAVLLCTFRNGLLLLRISEKKTLAFVVVVVLCNVCVCVL